MNAKVEQGDGNSSADIARLSLAGLIVVAGLVGFYYFVDQYGLALRIVGLLASFAIAIVIAAGTRSGRDLRVFIAESQFELRKVVWPTREETLRTTGVIIVVVVIISIVLGLIDLLLKVIVMDWLLKLGH